MLQVRHLRMIGRHLELAAGSVPRATAPWLYREAMVAVRVTALTESAADQLMGVARVFDQYRRHYGQPVVAGQTLTWLTEQTSHRRLAIFIAHVGDDLAGLATAMVVPASLRLGSSWQLRDLYVVPGARRRGVAPRWLAPSARQLPPPGPSGCRFRQSLATSRRSSSTGQVTSLRSRTSRPWRCPCSATAYDLLSIFPGAAR